MDEQAPPVRRAFYTLGNYLLAKEMVFSPSQYYICDRFWPSTHAYGAAEREETPATSTLPHDMPRPTRLFFFLLHLPEEARMERMRTREKITEEEGQLERDRVKRDLILEHYRSFEGMTEIDASLPTKEIVRLIRKAINLN